MKTKKIITSIGARPQIIKSSAISRAIRSNYSNILTEIIVHTGQHYDGKMSDIFFDQFNLIPDFFLNVPAGSPMEQMTEIKVRLKK